MMPLLVHDFRYHPYYNEKIGKLKTELTHLHVHFGYWVLRFYQQEIICKTLVKEKVPAGVKTNRNPERFAKNWGKKNVNEKKTGKFLKFQEGQLKSKKERRKKKKKSINFITFVLFWYELTIQNRFYEIPVPSSCQRLANSSCKKTKQEKVNF